MRILDDPAALGDIRATALALLPFDVAAELLPDATIVLRAVLAEAQVIDRVGTDWIAIHAGMAPAIYASGDPVAAQALLREAVLQYTCYALIPQLRQLMPQQEQTDKIRVVRDLNWSTVSAEVLAQAQMALDLLQPAILVPAGMVLAHPQPAPTDPAATPFLLGRRRIL